MIFNFYRVDKSEESIRLPNGCLSFICNNGTGFPKGHYVLAGGFYRTRRAKREGEDIFECIPQNIGPIVRQRALKKARRSCLPKRIRVQVP